jgi:serine/threonine-protein kinase RsbW
MSPAPDLAPKTGFDAMPMPAGQTLVFTADPAAVRDALASLLAMAPVLGLGADDRGTVELVLAEVLNNVAEHAYAGGSGPVEVDLQVTAAGLSCRVADVGLAMPDGMLPTGRLPSAQPEALEDLPEGGFGWYLIRTLTADLTYARSAGQNRLTFVIPLTDQP